MVKMVLGSSDAQGRTMSSVGKARVTAYNSAVTALSNFNGAGDLQGSAYDSGKQYGVSVITPLIKGAIMYSEYLSEAVPKLPSKYRSEVGGEDLDSAVLEREIQSLESSISSLRGTFRAMESSDHADKSLLQNISSRMDSLTSQKNEKMDKLRKLNLFAGSSNEVFSGEGAKSMDTVVKNLASGLNMIQGDFASFGGTFPKHSGKTLNWAKSIEGEWDKKAKIDEDYQKVLEKIKDGKELNEDDVKKIDAYKNRYSNRDIPDTVQVALDKHKKAIEDNEINKKRKIESKSNKTKKVTESKKSWWDNIVDFGTGVVDYIGDNLFGYENIVSIETPKNNQYHGGLYSTYNKETVKISKKKSGLINVKTENGHFSGIGIDFGVYNAEIGIENGHLNLEQETNILGYKGGSKVSVGVNPDTGLEVNAAIGAGTEKDGKSDMNYLGLKVSTDIQDGILGGYTENVQSKTSGDNVTTTSTEAGFQTINMYEAGAVATLVGLYFAWEALPVLAPYVQKVAEMVQNSGLTLIPQAQ